MSKTGRLGVSVERKWILIFASVLLVGALAVMFTYGGFGALTDFGSGMVLAASAVGLVLVLGFVALGVQRTITDSKVHLLALGAAAVTFFFANQITSHFNFAIYPLALAGQVEGADSAYIWVAILGFLLLVIAPKLRRR